MIVAFFLAMPLLAAEPIAVWPGFNGVGGNTSAISELPLAWSPTSNIAWRTSTPGSGKSGPVVWKESVYVSGIGGVENDQWKVTALRLSDGGELWTHSCAKISKSNRADAEDLATPTPAVDAAGLYVLGGNGSVVALTHGGQIRWRRSLTNDYGPIKSRTGLMSSLAQDESSIFVLVDHEGSSYLVALSKQTGETTWLAYRENAPSATSPVVATIDGVPQVITSSAGIVDAYDAATGRHLWGVRNLVGNVAPVPFVTGNYVLIGALPQPSPDDLVRSLRSNMALRVKQLVDGWSVRVMWRTAGVPSGLASPIAHNEHAYWTDRHGQFACLDLQSGEEVYSEQLEEPCEITPLVASGRIYLFGKHGTTTVLQLGPKPVVLAKNVIHPVLHDGQGGDCQQLAIAAVEGNLLLRTNYELVCVRQATRN